MDLFLEINKKNNNALSKAITLAESTLLEDQKLSYNLITKFPKKNNSIRIGITGIPGVGKSSFIEKFGQTFLKEGKSVAVLAIDPSSEKTKGSILGDKSRMETLSADKNTFIRPSSNNGALGGVSNKTRESILLCEAAGYDIIIIETVGVGQSETIVNQLVDIMVLLTITGAGDQLQAIKRGIIELAHLIVITKDDGDNKVKAKQTLTELKNIISININSDKNWSPKIVKCSAKENSGINEINLIINQFIEIARKENLFLQKREKQEIYWIKKTIREEIGNKKFKEMEENKKINTILNDVIFKKKSLIDIIQKI
mgnify:FL=1